MEQNDDKAPENAPVVDVPKETTEVKEEAPKGPIVSVAYHPRGPVTPGIPSDIRVDLETYNKAYTKTVQTLQEVEKSFKADHPEATEEELQRAGSDHILDRIGLLESIIASNRLEWSMYWRVFEDRLKIASEAERTRARKADAERRRTNIEGPEAVRVPRVKRLTSVPTTPEGKSEAAINLLMRNFKLTREEAMDRLRMVVAVKTVKLDEEPVE